MCEVTMTWNEFLQEAKQFYAMSQKIGDDWILHEKDENEPNTFLIYKQKIKSKSSGDEEASNILINIEYHVVYSISYQIPVLYFQSHRSDGSILDLEATWRTFMPSTPTDELYETLTQMEHPVLFRPFMALHPCRTSTILGQFGEKKSKNRVLTFISLYGPFVKLSMSNEYAKLSI